MKINHLIIGISSDPKLFSETLALYTNILGLKEIDRFIDTGTNSEGRVLVSQTTGKEDLEILLVPFKSERLPNPQHIAFEVSAENFKLFTSAREREVYLSAQNHR